MGAGWEAAGSSSPVVVVALALGWPHMCPWNLGEQCPLTHPQQGTALPCSCLPLFLLHHLCQGGRWALRGPRCSQGGQGRLSRDPWASPWRWGRAEVLRESISSEPGFGEGMQGQTQPSSSVRMGQGSSSRAGRQSPGQPGEQHHSGQG